MKYKFPLIIAIIFSILFIPTMGQDKKVPAKAKKIDIPVVKTMDQAKETFTKAWNFDREEKYEQAIAYYKGVLEFFNKQKDKKFGRYSVDVYANIGIIYAKQGKYTDSIKSFKDSLKLSLEVKDYVYASELYHKIGVLYARLASMKSNEKSEKDVIYPKNYKKEYEKLFGDKETYTRVTRVGNEFIANKITIKGSKNPFEKKREFYSKIISLKLKGDFDPTELLSPDSVELFIQIRKSGYYPISKTKSLLPGIEFSEIDEIMVSIPRKVEPQVTEDFYREGLVNPDEITLTPLVDGKPKGKPTQITEKETFKPGRYLLSIQKAGYNPIKEPLVIFPHEGAFELKRELKSKLRNIVYSIRGDFTPLGGDIVPDEISLNSQPVRKDSKVKPGEYKLVVKEDGYEPIIESIVIPPDERPYTINKFMKSLPREVIFQLTSDYQPQEFLTADEVTFNGRFVKYGESVRPDIYRVSIRKKGYDPITKRIIIEPKSKPYMLKEKLISTPRRIEKDIQASFPSGMKLYPEVCTLNQKEVGRETAFKPGEYNLLIRKKGYHQVTRKVKIAPDDLPYIIKQVLEPKDVKINLDITQDILPEDPDAKFVVKLENERTSEILTINHGNKIQPEVYLLKIEMPGYDPHFSKITVLPSEEPYLIRQKLIASFRRVVTQITSEYPEGETIVPDEITIDNKPLEKDFKIKPGVHDLVILKEGYMPIRKPINIKASEKDYILVEELETRRRLVSFEFRDSFDRRELNPKEIYVGKERLGSSKQTLNLKPGDYKLKVHLKGYAHIDETINIPVGNTQYNIVKFMIAIKRDVISDITGDYNSEEKLTPDVFTLNDIPIPPIGKTSVKPGAYNLVIEKAGYYPIMKRITIVPDPKPYEIKEKMISKPRQVNILVKSNFSKSKTIPDSLVLGTQNVKESSQIKPGEYPLLIKKKGYKHLTEEVVVTPSEKPLNLEYEIEALPRLVKYEITNDFDGSPVVPDLISLNDKIVDGKTSFLPGKYTVKIDKIGYNSKNFEIEIQPSDEPYIIKTIIESLSREIGLVITGDWPEGERFEPDIAAFDGKDVRDNIFKPGKYELVIQQPGYETLTENILLPPGEEPYLIEKMLITKPREVKEKISFDVDPPSSLAPYKITIAPLNNPRAEKQIKEGDKVKPNSYVIKIKKEAYQDVQAKLNVWPAEMPLELNYNLIAKQRIININITYDVDPPKNLPDYKVSLIDKDKGISRFVQNGKKVKPGSYLLTVQRDGYSFGTRKDMEILPSEQPYMISEKLIAKPRKISFDMVDQKDNLIPAHQILINGKEISFNDVFKPGTKFELIVKFKKFKTVKKVSEVIPGEGPFVEHVDIKQLIPYEFQVRQKEITLDNIKYNYEYYADSDKIESHHIKIEKGLNKFYTTVFVEPEAKVLKVFAGYKFTQREFSRLRLGIGRITNISVPKLIEHLDRVAKKDERGFRASLDIMEKMLKLYSNRKYLKAAHSSEIDRLIQFIEGWRLVGSTDRIRMKVVIESLEKLK